MPFLLRPGRRRNPLSYLAGAVVLAALVGILRTQVERSTEQAQRCDPTLDDLCEDSGFEESEGINAPLMDANRPTGPVLSASDVCGTAGYLCSDLEREERIRIRHWKDFTGPLVVYVPEPSFENRADARSLQRAAIMGIRLWNGQPFPVEVVQRPDREHHFAVEWRQSLGGSQIGVARTQWSPSTGLKVVSLELVTRSPYRRASIVDPHQVRLTAAHEMGHALGLSHSDSERDVMYPTSTATSLSGQDYRTMAALYDLEDGTEIVR